MTSPSRLRPLLNVKPLKTIAGLALTVPLMACNYKGPAYDCPPEEIDEQTGFCIEQDGGLVDGGIGEDGGPQLDAGALGDAGAIDDAGTDGDSETSEDAGSEADGGTQP